jgi:hypothetical protein
MKTTRRGLGLCALVILAGCGSSTDAVETPEEPIGAGGGGTVQIADAAADRAPAKDSSTPVPDAAKDTAVPKDAASADAHFAGTPNIMPLGDSITASTCWRARLAEKLDAGKYTYHFVGSQTGDPGCGATYDKDHEGHGGMLVADQDDAAFAGWFNANPPDIVLMHFGTNDCWGGQRSTQQILDAYTRAVTNARTASPNVIFLVAQIIPLSPSGCTVCDATVPDLNDAIPGWAAGIATAASPIVVVDQYTGFDDTTDTRDMVHPNDAGSIKMANRWYEKLASVL